MLEVAERFLEEELNNSGPRFNPVDRARFHRVVKLCAENWARHPQAGLRVNKGKQGLTLFFEGPLGSRIVPIFTMRVDYKKGEYRFSGPTPDRQKLELGEDSLESLERLRDLYEALLAKKRSDETSITAVLAGKPFPDLVPLVEESRRVLDGGSDGTQAPPQPRRSSSKKSKGDSSTGSQSVNGTTNKGAKSNRDEGAGPSAVVGGSSAKLSFGETHLMKLVLSCPEPKESAAFYRRLFGVKSLGSDGPHVHAIYDIGGVALVLREDLTQEERREQNVGSTKRHRGWGATFVLRVPEYSGCLRRVKRIPEALIKADPENRILWVRDPAGYVLELVEGD